MIMEGQKERQGDFVFSAKDPGEYKFCFNNEMSTFAEKLVDFEIAVSLPPPASSKLKRRKPCNHQLPNQALSSP